MGEVAAPSTGPMLELGQIPPDGLRCLSRRPQRGDPTGPMMVRRSHFNQLGWAQANGCPLVGDTWALVAAEAITILKWAEDKSLRWWDEETCAGAALGGHLEILEWARANGGMG